MNARRPPLSSKKKTSLAPSTTPPQKQAKPPQKQGYSQPKTPKEIKYYGLKACLALWRNRPNAIRRVYLLETLIPQVGDLLRWCAQQSKPYQLVPKEDLERLTKSEHHQGICVVAPERVPLDGQSFAQQLQQEHLPPCILYLDGVGNPHNIGAICRIGAFFGIPYLLGQNDQLPRYSPALCYAAEGGAEQVTLVHLSDPVRELSALKTMGFSLVASALRKSSSLYQQTPIAPLILVLGSESTGISPTLLKLADVALHIPGTGQMESLNVSSACAVFLAEFWRLGILSTS